MKQLTVNGQNRTIAAKTVAELLQEMQLPATGVAVAVNQQVIPRLEHESRRLQEGDVVELVRAVQGG